MNHITGAWYNEYKPDSYSLNETLKDSETISDHDIIKGGTGEDRIYSGSDATIVDLGVDDDRELYTPDGERDIVTYTGEDIAIFLPLILSMTLVMKIE